MKNQMLSQRSIQTRVISMAILLLFCLILTFTAFASNVNQASTNGDPISEYVEKNSQTPLVKYYLNDKNDKTALRALRGAILLSDNESLKTFDQKTIQNIQTEHNQLMENILKVDAMVNSGISYARAKGFVNSTTQEQNKQAKTSEKDSEINIDNNGVQIIAIPSSK